VNQDKDKEQDDRLVGTRPSPPAPNNQENPGDTSADTETLGPGGFGQSAEPGMGELEKDTDAKAVQSSTQSDTQEPAQPEADDPRTDAKAAAYRNRAEEQSSQK
jgi:hypothetical protein